MRCESTLRRYVSCLAEKQAAKQAAERALQEQRDVNVVTETQRKKAQAERKKAEEEEKRMTPPITTLLPTRNPESINVFCLAHSRSSGERPWFVLIGFERKDSF